MGAVDHCQIEGDHNGAKADSLWLCDQVDYLAGEIRHEAVYAGRALRELQGVSTRGAVQREQTVDYGGVVVSPGGAGDYLAEPRRPASFIQTIGQIHATLRGLVEQLVA